MLTTTLLCVLALSSTFAQNTQCEKKCAEAVPGQLCVTTKRGEFDRNDCPIVCPTKLCDCVAQPCAPLPFGCFYDNSDVSITGEPGCTLSCGKKVCQNECPKLDCAPPPFPGCNIKTKAIFKEGCQVTCDEYDCCVRPQCAAPPPGCSYKGGDECSCGQLVCCPTSPTKCEKLVACTESQLLCPEANCCDTKQCTVLTCPKVPDSCKIVKTYKNIFTGCEEECPAYECPCLPTPCPAPPAGCVYENGGPSVGPFGCVNYCGNLRCCGEPKPCEKLVPCTTQQWKCAEANCCDKETCPILECEKPLGNNCKIVKEYRDQRGCEYQCPAYECEKDCRRIECPAVDFAKCHEIKKPYIDFDGCQQDCGRYACPCTPEPCNAPKYCEYTDKGNAWGDPGCVQSCGTLKCCPPPASCDKLRVCTLEESQCPDAHCCDPDVCPTLDCPEITPNCEIEKEATFKAACKVKCPVLKCKCDVPKCLPPPGCSYVDAGPFVGEAGCVAKCGTLLCCGEAQICKTRVPCTKEQLQCPEANCCDTEACTVLENCPVLPDYCEVEKRYFDDKKCEYQCPAYKCQCPPFEKSCPLPIDGNCKLLEQAPLNPFGCQIGCPKWDCIVEPQCKDITCPAIPENCHVVRKAIYDNNKCLIGCPKFDCSKVCPLLACAVPKGDCHVVEDGKKDQYGCLLTCPKYDCKDCANDECVFQKVPNNWRCKRDSPIYDANGCIKHCGESYCEECPPVLQASCPKLPSNCYREIEEEIVGEDECPKATCGKVICKCPATEKCDAEEECSVEQLKKYQDALLDKLFESNGEQCDVPPLCCTMPTCTTCTAAIKVLAPNFSASKLFLLARDLVEDTEIVVTESDDDSGTFVLELKGDESTQDKAAKLQKQLSQIDGINQIVEMPIDNASSLIAVSVTVVATVTLALL